MVNGSFFLAIASVAVTLAGFSALLSAFRPSDVAGSLAAWRIRMIVRLGFGAATAALAVMAIDTYVDDPNAVIRLATLAALAKQVPTRWVVQSLADGEVFRNRGETLGFIAGWSGETVLLLINLVLASTGLLIVTYIVMVVQPMTIFINFVGENYAPPRDRRTAPVG